MVFQIQSSVTSSYLTSSASILDMEELAESPHEANLGTTLYVLMFLQQIINPAVFLYYEFISK